MDTRSVVAIGNWDDPKRCRQDSALLPTRPHGQFVQSVAICALDLASRSIRMVKRRFTLPSVPA